MIVYILLFALFAMISIIDVSRISKKTKKIYIVSLAIVIILISGLRWQVGNDWYAYYSFFEFSNRLDDFLLAGFEPGYAILNYIIKIVFDNYSLLLFFMPLLIIFLKYKIIYLLSAYPMVSLMLNFANSNGDIFPVRQSIAVAICLYSIQYIVFKEKNKFIICVLLAGTFHLTALCFLSAYYIYYKEISNKKIVLFLLFCVVLGQIKASTDILVDLITYIVGNVFADQVMLDKIIAYQLVQEAGDNFDAAYSSFLTSALGIARRLFFIPVLIFYKNEFMKIDKKYDGLLKLTCFGYGLFCILLNFSVSVAGRLSMYYCMVEIFTIPYIVCLANKWNGKIIILFMLVIYSAVKYAYGLSIYFDDYIPYRMVRF